MGVYSVYRKLGLAVALLAPGLAWAGSYPSPHVNNMTVDGTITGGAISGSDASAIKVTITGGTLGIPLSTAFTKLDPRTFGNCTWDSSHDTGACVQAAVDFAQTLPYGATIAQPPGNFAWATAVNISKSSVSFEAPGRGGKLRNNVAPTTKYYGSKITWIGTAGATMLTVSPPTDTVAGQPISGNNVQGILFEANSTAGTCVRMASVWGSKIDLACSEPTSDGVVFDTASIAAENSFQNNDIWLDVVNRTGTGAAVVLTSTGNISVGQGNVSGNRFHIVKLTVLGGDGLVLKHADNNWFEQTFVSVLPTGTGRCVDLKGSSDTFAPVGSEANLFNHYSCNGAFIAEGTDAGWTTPSRYNRVNWLDVSNSTPAPTIGTGASIVWGRSDNITSAGGAALQMDFAPTPTLVARLRALGNTDPVRVYSSANAGILFGAQQGGTDLLAHAYIDPTSAVWTLATIGGVNGFLIGGPNAPMIANGRLKTQGTAPTVSACGTTPSTVTGNSIAGKLTMGTASPTACTLTFNTTNFAVAPVCVANLAVSGAPVAVAPTTVSTSAVTFTAASAATSGVLTYHCIEPT